MAQEIKISDENYRELKTMLAGRGDSVDVDAYVNRALSRDLFFETVSDIKARTKDVNPEELDQIINEAVEAARAERRKQSPGVDRS